MCRPASSTLSYDTPPIISTPCVRVYVYVYVYVHVYVHVYPYVYVYVYVYVCMYVYQYVYVYVYVSVCVCVCVCCVLCVVHCVLCVRTKGRREQYGGSSSYTHTRIHTHTPRFSDQYRGSSRWFRVQGLGFRV